MQPISHLKNIKVLEDIQLKIDRVMDSFTPGGDNTCSDNYLSATERINQLSEALRGDKLQSFCATITTLVTTLDGEATALLDTKKKAHTTDEKNELKKQFITFTDKVSDPITNIISSLQQTGLSKKQTGLSKKQTDHSKQQTDHSKQQIDHSKQQQKKPQAETHTTYGTFKRAEKNHPTVFARPRTATTVRP